MLARGCKFCALCVLCTDTRFRCRAQFVLNELLATHTPPQWALACAAVDDSALRVPYAWATLSWRETRNASASNATRAMGADLTPERVVALPEWAAGRVCALNGTLSLAGRHNLAAAVADPAALLAALLRPHGLLTAWPQPLAAAHLVFTPAAVRLKALRALGWWFADANGTLASGSRSGAACFARHAEPVVLLSMPGSTALLLLCAEEPREDGQPCCTHLEPRSWPWPVDALSDDALKVEHIRRTFPGCVAWDWDRGTGST